MRKEFPDVLGKEEVQEFIRRANDRYLHWDKVRFQPLPTGLNPRLVWLAIQFSRGAQLTRIPLAFQAGSQLSYWIPPQQHEWLSFIDQKAGGNLGTRSKQPIPDDNDRYLFNSLMEESIASSQLEGASTTREVAKQMLRTQRAPRDKAEQMIVNNYKAILEIRDMLNDDLTPEMLCHLQNVLTDGTLETPDMAGRFRLPTENIHVVDNRTNELIYEPPPAKEVEPRIAEVCRFANTRSKPFVHPIIKAMALHFAIGFIHPFGDGNGRTARAIFYWYMLKHGYWMFEYLPISRIIINAPIRYARSFLYTETDGGDLTYFNQHHLYIVKRAVEDLYSYLELQQLELQQADEILDKYPNLGNRQRAMVQNALKYPGHHYTIKEQAGKFRVTYNTARSDLLGLESAGLFTRQKISGKEWVFRPVPNLFKCLKGRNAEAAAKTAAKAGTKATAKKKPSREVAT